MSTSRTVANGDSSRFGGIGSFFKANYVKGLVLVLFVIPLLSLHQYRNTSSKDRPPSKVIESPILETVAMQLRTSAVSLQDIAVPKGGQLHDRLFEADIALQGTHAIVITCRTFIIKDVASSIGKAKKYPSFKNFQLAERRVNTGRRDIHEVMQSLDGISSMINKTDAAVAQAHADITMAKRYKWRELLKDLGGWLMGSMSEGEATELQQSYGELDTLLHRLSSVNRSLYGGRCVVEDEYDRFSILDTHLGHVAAQLQSIVHFDKRVAASDETKAPSFSNEIGTELHASIIERMFLDALAAHIGSDEGVQAIETFYMRNNA